MQCNSFLFLYICWFHEIFAEKENGERTKFPQFPLYCVIIMNFPLFCSLDIWSHEKITIHFLLCSLHYYYSPYFDFTGKSLLSCTATVWKLLCNAITHKIPWNQLFSMYKRCLLWWKNRWFFRIKIVIVFWKFLVLSTLIEFFSGFEYFYFTQKSQKFTFSLHIVKIHEICCQHFFTKVSRIFSVNSKCINVTKVALKLMLW